MSGENCLYSSSELVKKDKLLIISVTEVGVMKSVGKKSLLGVDDIAMTADADKEVDFLADFDVTIPTKHIRQFVSVDHDRRLLDGAGPEEHIENFFGTSWKKFFAGFPACFVNEIALRANENDGGVFLESFQLGGEAAWAHDIVGVHAGDPFRAGKINSPIGGGRAAQVFGVSENPNPFIFLGVVFENLI